MTTTDKLAEMQKIKEWLADNEEHDLIEYADGVIATLTTQQSEINRLRDAFDEAVRCANAMAAQDKRVLAEWIRKRSSLQAALAEGKSHENT